VTSCAPEEPAPAAPVHTHAPVGGWDRDPYQHWKLCECGERLEAADHDLTDVTCAICSSDIWDFGEGIFDVHTYNEYGDIVRMSSYAPDGSLTGEYVYQPEYDADGHKTAERQFMDGRLFCEDEYALHPDGWTYLLRSTSYEEDGRKSINEYNEEGAVIRAVSYTADGALDMEVTAVYAHTEEGELYAAEETTSYGNTTYFCTYNEYGDITSRVKYEDDVMVDEERYEQEYNDEGKPLWKKTYRNDMLIYEVTGYIVGSDGSSSWRIPEKTIDYYESGGKLVTRFREDGSFTEQEFDAAGELLNCVEYDADSNPIS